MEELMSDSIDPSSEEFAAKRGSAAPGCCILTAIVGVFGGLVVLYIGVGLFQVKSFAGITQDKAAVVEIGTPAPAVVESALAKLHLIGQAVSESKSERVLFNAAELNALIATLDEAEGFRGNTRIERIDPQGLVIRMSQPLRKGPFQKGFQYLNADFVLEPELRARSIAFKVRDIHPDSGELPKGFVAGYASLDLFRLDPDLPAIQANVPSLEAVYIEEDQLVVETKTAEDITTPGANAP